jgi:hypothetical protein
MLLAPILVVDMVDVYTRDGKTTMEGIAVSDQNVEKMAVAQDPSSLPQASVPTSAMI